MTRSSPANAQDIRVLVDAIQELSRAGGIERIQQIVRSAARTLARADGATFVLREGDRCFYADEDAIAPLWKGQRFPMQACVSGWVMINQQAAVIPDIYQDDRVPHEAYRPTFVRSMAMLPIRTVEPVGAIGIYWSRPHQPSATQMEQLRALADSTAVAIENVAVRSELEHRVAARTQELESAYLRLKEEAETRRAQLAEQKRLNRSLEFFSSHVAHDLRNPLATIQMTADMIEQAGENADLRGQFTAALNRQASRAVELIDELLDLSHASTTARCTTFPVMPMLLEVQALLPDVTIAIGRVPETVNADRLSLRQALVNLAANAGKYGSADVDIGADGEHGQIVFWVADRGPGLDPNAQQRVFTAFERGHGATVPGSGLGLAIVAAAAESHGGRAWYEDRPGGGAIFKVAIPQ